MPGTTAPRRHRTDAGLEPERTGVPGRVLVVLDRPGSQVLSQRRVNDRSIDRSIGVWSNNIDTQFNVGSGVDQGLGCTSPGRTVAQPQRQPGDGGRGRLRRRPEAKRHCRGVAVIPLADMGNHRGTHRSWPRSGHGPGAPGSSSSRRAGRPMRTRGYGELPRSFITSIRRRGNETNRVRPFGAGKVDDTTSSGSGQCAPGADGRRARQRSCAGVACAGGGPAQLLDARAARC